MAGLGLSAKLGLPAEGCLILTAERSDCVRRHFYFIHNLFYTQFVLYTTSGHSM